MDLQIQNKVEQLYNFLISLNLRVFFIGLYGSQNYRLNTGASDVDTKALVIPTLQDIAKNNPLENKDYNCDQIGNITSKDIRLMIDCFWKQNVNFLEILYTDYTLVNPMFLEEFRELYQLRDRIAKYNNYKLLNCVFGMARQKYFVLLKIREMEESYGKHLYHILRLCNFVSAYCQNKSFSDCLIWTEFYSQETMFQAKENKFSIDDSLNMAARAIEQMEEIIANYKSENPLKIDEEVRARVEEIITKIFIKSIRLDLEKEEENERENTDSC